MMARSSRSMEYKLFSTNARPCERRCVKCGLWKHFSRFRNFRQHGSLKDIGFSAKCRDCEQIERNEKKNEDRPSSIIDNRAAVWARKLGVTKEFMLVNMNWNALKPVLRAMMSDEGLCLSCGHGFEGDRDIQIEHREPPRDNQDWARHHARNIGIFCQSCNGTKGNKPYAPWLDEQEEARISNERHRAGDPQIQFSLDLFAE